MSIVIVDYGVGNLGSIQNMLKRLGADAIVTSEKIAISDATKLVLPGVGSFNSGMSQLNASGLRAALDAAVLVRNVPVAGICLGMQMMTEGSEEGQLPGLGWVPARTMRFAPTAGETTKVPHMGWNTVTQVKDCPVLEFLEDESRFYFVHSYYVRCSCRNDALLTTQYGSVTFDAAFQRNNVFGFQFHPEKSHRFGMALLKGFLEKY